MPLLFIYKVSYITESSKKWNIAQTFANNHYTKPFWWQTLAQTFQNDQTNIWDAMRCDWSTG